MGGEGGAGNGSKEGTRSARHAILDASLGLFVNVKLESGSGLATHINCSNIAVASQGESFAVQVCSQRPAVAPLKRLTGHGQERAPHVRAQLHACA